MLRNFIIFLHSCWPLIQLWAKILEISSIFYVMWWFLEQWYGQKEWYHTVLIQKYMGLIKLGAWRLLEWSGWCQKWHPYLVTVKGKSLLALTTAVRDDLSGQVAKQDFIWSIFRIQKICRASQKYVFWFLHRILHFLRTLLFSSRTLV